jgi:SAM-dependent methyltransferase
MKRRPEPELMEGTDQALAYAEADFSEANSLFLELLGRLEPGPLHGARALDLGCGPADIVIRFLRAYPHAHCDALDGSEAMLAHARATLGLRPGLAARCALIHDRLPSPRLPRTQTCSTSTPGTLAGWARAVTRSRWSPG